MPFTPYEQLVEPLAFTYRGTTYTLPDVSIDDTIRLNVALDPDSGEAVTPEEWERILLGELGPKMRAETPAAFYQRVFAAAIAEFRWGRDVAVETWERGALPKASSTPAAEDPPSTDSSPSTSSGEAIETPSPASTPGTRTSRPKQPRSRKTTTAS